LFSENTLKAILRRNRVKKRTRKSANGQRRPLYDYEALSPFHQLQLDTKHLLDKQALPPEVYHHMKAYGLPRYEWHLMDVATRARFTAYSYELSAAFGFMFVLVVLLWLRSHNMRGPISIRVDNGTEFCGGSPKKLQDWNRRLRILGATLKPIPPGAKHLLALVENAHRDDDECFLIVHAERCLHTLAFIHKAQCWQDTWNLYRPHQGLAMNGHVLLFPTVLLESLLKTTGPFNQFLNQSIGGKYVYTKCPILKRNIFACHLLNKVFSSRSSIFRRAGFRLLLPQINRKRGEKIHLVQLAIRNFDSGLLTGNWTSLSTWSWWPLVFIHLFRSI